MNERLFFGVITSVCIVAFVVGIWHVSMVLIFLMSAASVILLARLIGQATEALGTWFGSGVGALLGATFGNSVELIIALLALRAGLYSVVKATVIGGIMANLLLTLGVCMIVAGFKTSVQKFSRVKAGVNSAMLFVAVIGLSVTSMYAMLNHGVHHVQAFSVGVAIVLLLVYIMGSVFSLFTHRSFLTPDVSPVEKSKWSARKAMIVLMLSTVLVSYFSDELVGTVHPLAVHLGLSQEFIGLVFLPLIGITPELFIAVLLARRNQMDGSVEIAVGSSLQIALFVGPVLVIAGAFMHQLFTLVFTPTEAIVLFLSTILISLVSLDGETHWFEGMMVLSTYVIFAMLFFFQ